MAAAKAKKTAVIGENDELFELIQKLSKAERRYFKIHFAGTAHGDLSMYEKLFDAMAAMKTLDAGSLDRRFKQWTGWKYYSKTKHYLIDAIFDAMRSYYRSQSLQDSLYDMASNLRFLRDRGLESHYERLLQQAKSMCYETEMLIPLLDILVVEEGYAVRMLRDVSSVHEEIMSVLRDMQLEEDALHLNRQTFALYKKHGLRGSDEVREQFARTITAAKELEQRARQIMAKAYANAAQALSHHSRNEHREGVQCIQRNIEMFESFSPRAFRHRVDMYMVYLSQIATFSFNTRDAEYFDEVKNYIVERISRTEGAEVSKFELSVQTNFLSMILHQDYESVVENAQLVDQNLEVFKQISIVTQGDITFNMSLGFLKIGNKNKALEWLLRVFEIPHIEEREQIYLYARLYEILLHWGLDHTELVLAKTLSFKRFLAKRQSLGEFERVFIRFMNAAVLNDSTEGFAKAMHNFGEDVSNLDPAQYAGIIRNYTEMLLWFEKK